VTETKSPHDAPRAIDSIAKNDAARGLRAFSYPSTHPAITLWSAHGTGLLDRLEHWLQSGDFHPGRTLVLLPYAQLLPLARRLWSERYPQGFAPRFETTSNWLATLGRPPVLATDICHDMALDNLTARQLLTQGGMADRAALAGLLAQSAQQLAPFAAAAGPQGREVWAAAARKAVGIDMESQAVAWEAQMLQVSVEWAAISAYPTDVLFEQNILEAWDAVAWVQGISEDPVATALAARWGGGPACSSWMTRIRPMSQKR